MDAPTTLVLLASAAFGAGILNAIAGGGTFLTFPALVWAGVPPIAANATSALAVCPGYAGSALGFRAELAALPRTLRWREMTISAIGGAIVWRHALLMALFALLGGFAGARLAKRLPTAWVRAIVIVTGLVMSALFFARVG